MCKAVPYYTAFSKGLGRQIVSRTGCVLLLTIIVVLTHVTNNYYYYTNNAKLAYV